MVTSKEEIKDLRLLTKQTTAISVWFILCTRIFPDPSARDKYNFLQINWIHKTYGARIIRLLGLSSLYVKSVNSPQMKDSAKKGRVKLGLGRCCVELHYGTVLGTNFDPGS